MSTSCKMSHQFRKLTTTDDGSLFSKAEKQELAHWCELCGAFRHRTSQGYWTEWFLPEQNT